MITLITKVTIVTKINSVLAITLITKNKSSFFALLQILFLTLWVAYH
jgi:hypothetical protein